MLGSQFIYAPTTSAAVPAEYKPNYKFAPQRAQIQDTLYKIDAKRKNGQTVDTFYFKDLEKAFIVVFDYMPQTPAYKGIYESCHVGAQELSRQYDINTMSLFSNNCLNPLNEIFKEIQNSYTVKAKIVASPEQGSAPLTVTFDGRWSADEASNTTIPSNNYYRYFTDTNGVEQSIGRWPVVKYTFKTEWRYVVNLTVRSANADDKWVFDGQSSVNVNVGPQAAKLIVFTNGRKLQENIAMKFTSQEASDGLRIDGSATAPLWWRQIMKYEWNVVNSDQVSLYKNWWNGSPGSFKLRLIANGSYMVTLKIIDNENNTVESTNEIIIADPIATIKVTPTEDGNTSSIYTFDASPSYSVQSTLKSYTRTVTDSDGNEVASNQWKSFQQKFSKPGVYRAKVRVVDQLWNDNEEAITVTVWSTPPVPQFTMEPTKERTYPSQFALDASPSYDIDTANDNDALTYERSFSNNDNVNIDETLDGGKRIKVSFKEKGTYKVTLTVKDSYGKIAETQRDITITSSLRPRITLSPISTQLGNSTTFIAKTNKLVANYEWDFWDGTKSTKQDDRAVHTYKKVWNYKVKLTATTAEWEQNDVYATAFIGEANSPIPGYSILNARSDALIPEGICKDPSGVSNPAYLIERYQDLTIDGSNSINVQGGKENLLYYFKPEQAETSKKQQLAYKFDETWCHFVDFTVEDTAISKQASSRIRFFVTNAKPKIQNILMTFPQIGSSYGIGVWQNTNKDTFKVDADPLVVKVDAVNVIDPDGSISKYKWYYYNIDDPQRWLEIKYTPASIPYAYFSLPKIAGEYRFGLEVYDNDGASTKSEEILGKWPVVFFPPDSKNPDIPIVTLKVDRVNAKVGDQVTLETVANITSNRNDFGSNRTISYDFDGDWTRDLTTKDTKVTYVYKTPWSYNPKVKVSYRNRSGIAYGDSINIEKWVKAGFIYAALGNILLIRDTSYGEINSRKFCLNVRQCQTNPSRIIENQTYFKKEYPTPWKYVVRYDVQDKNGNVSSVGNVIDIAPTQTASDIWIATLPMADTQGVVSVGKALENKVLFYVSFNGKDCYIDADISKDSSSTWRPDQNRDIACNAQALYEYKPSIGSTVARVYFSQWDKMVSKDITIQFLDYKVSLSADTQATYDMIDATMIRLGDNLPDIKSILLQIRNAVVEWDDTSSLVLQLKDVVENKNKEIDPLTLQQINAVLQRLEDKTVVSAQWGSIYETARTSIIDYFPANRKAEVAKIFEEIDNKSSDKALIKNNLNKVLDVAQAELKKWTFTTDDMQIIQSEVCRIINYHDIKGTSCKLDSEITGDVVAPPTTTTSSSSIWNTGWKVLKVIWIIAATVWAGFVVLVIIFALKAKKKEEPAA
jgi:PKD repeat protein